MWKNVKTGFGFAIGWELAQIIIKEIEEISVTICKSTANDENYMDWLKERNPDLYKRIIHYKTKKEEYVETEEEAQ